MRATQHPDDDRILLGAQAIADHLDLPLRKTQHLIKLGEVPTFTMGRHRASTPALIRDAIAEKARKAAGR